MPTTRILTSGAVTVVDYHCQASPHDIPFPEVHGVHSLSYVRRGSFGCRTGGRTVELVPGSVMLGRRGQEYVCTHDHALGGDDCLSIQVGEEALDAITGSETMWESGSVPPLPELMVLGELAQAAAEGNADADLEEVALLMTARLCDVLTGKERRALHPGPRDRRRAIEAAMWIDEHSCEPVSLEDAAAVCDLSPFHFLRLFSQVVGATPHQYLVRSRLRHAARLLAAQDRDVTDVAYEVGFGDLSNFVRTFGRAAGVSPGQFRAAARAGHGLVNGLAGFGARRGRR